MAKILIIDDEKMICSCLAQIAEAEGHEAQVAPDGISGTEVARTFCPALIFVDLLMPGRAGLETIVELRKELPGSQIVAMTGQPIVGTVSLLELARRFGAEHVLEKPFRAHEIAGLIREILTAPPVSSPM